MGNNYNDAIDELSEHIRKSREDKLVYDRELDALYDCLEIIKENQASYEAAIFFAPKYKDRLKKDFDKVIANAKSQQEIDDICLEWDGASPLESKVKEIKDEIINDCRSTLKNADIGNKRINIFIPILTKYLKGYDLRNRNEKDSDEAQLRLTENIIKRFNND